ncbi:MAG: prepilin-type N-terminal cleavage/methylation domain-containing protein [Candidatus Obscuribacter sp.]|nr:prepilin-type N-terminal cleavage/methylation domain-containing protein [Candidatus Obscuribacter sp.]
MVGLKSKFHHKRLTHLRNCKNGFSIVEMLVSLVVIGIAIAGLTELLWVNASWSSMLHNKYDNYVSAQLFLQRLENDVKHARKVKVTSNNRKLLLEGPLLSQFNGHGFITGVTKYYYSVEPDPTRLGEFRVVRVEDTKPEQVVLRGVIGPKSLNGLDVITFKYIERGKPEIEASEVLNVPSEMDISVLQTNLELRKDDLFGKTSEVNLDSFICN